MNELRIMVNSREIKRKILEKTSKLKVIEKSKISC